MGADSTGGYAGHRRMIAVLALAILVSGCAAVRPAVTGADFRLQGKIAVRGAGEAFSASFDWIQTGEVFDIELWGPLGQGRTRLQGDGDRLTITDARGTTVAGINAEPFMMSALGWSVPVSALPHWVRGRHDPADGVTGERRAADGSTVRFEQSGWTVEVSGWGMSALGPVPGRIVAAQDDRRIVIACKEWSHG